MEKDIKQHTDKDFQLETEIKGILLRLKTSGEVFSPKGIDRGTLAMLSAVDFKKEDRVLDLGCGYGVVGILASKLIGSQNVVMSDIDEGSVGLARENAILNGVGEVMIYKSNGFKDIPEGGFTLILSNPPYHEDFSVPKEFIEKGFNRLAVGGRMVMVTKRREWYRNKLSSIFGGAMVYERDGYYVFISEKRDMSYAKKARKQL